MKLRYVLKTSIEHLFKNIKSSFIVLFSLTVCMTAVFMLTEVLLGYTDFWENVSLYKRTYGLQMNGNASPAESKAFAKMLLFDDRFGRVEKIDQIQANPTNHYASSYIAAEVYLEESDRYSPEIELTEGRLFTDEEMVSGENVIVLSEFESGEVGDTVRIEEAAYLVIGKCSGVLSFLTWENVMRSNRISLTVNTVTFEKKLSGSRAEDFFAAAEKVGASPETLFERHLAGTVLQNTFDTCSILLVLLCAAGICSQLFRYMVESRRYEYSVYKVLGICRATLLCFFYTPILLLSVISFGLGFAIYRATEPLQKYVELTATLGVLPVFVIAVVMFLVILTVTAPIFRNLKRVSPIERM